MTSGPDSPATPPGWEGILEEGERILWQGQPEPGVPWRKLVSSGTAMSLFVAGFGVFWTVMAFEMLSSMRSAPPAFRLLFPVFGIVFVAAALWGSFGETIKAAFRASGTFYTLTTRAAYIATEIAGQRDLRRFPLAEIGSLRLTDGRPGSVTFAADEIIVTRDEHQSVRRRDLGFERIAEAREVFALMREAQAALRAADETLPPPPGSG